MTYSKEFLISELQRFVSENDTNPRFIDMQSKFGYVSAHAYTNCFGTWNNALIEAGLDINLPQTHSELDGSETCSNCGCKKEGSQNWLYKNEQRLCKKCYNNSDYTNGNLDPESSTGFAFLSQRVVAKTLGLDLEHDCNCSQGFGSEYDLLDDKLGTINVKTYVLNNNNFWSFNLINKYKPDTYIMLGFASDKSDILHVWITEPEDDLTFDDKKDELKKGISITNSERGLKRAAPWEVDAEPYSDAYHSMSLENCSVLKG